MTERRLSPPPTARPGTNRKREALARVELVMDEQKLRAILESLLFAAGEPVSLARLGNALESEPRESIRQALTAMAAAYLNDGRGLVLEEIAGGYQLRTPSEHASYIRRLLSAKPPRLSRPLLETLSIIAYRRQVTRPEIEHLRGVDTGGVLETLLERGLIRIAGRKDAPGRPIFYETTHGFLELFGLRNLDELPDLEEFRAIEGSLAEVIENSAGHPAEPDATTAADATTVEDAAGASGDRALSSNDVSAEAGTESAAAPAAATGAAPTGESTGEAVTSPAEPGDDRKS